MRKRRETEGFNLSFLDIMACGLGAAVLILILLKLQPEEDPIDLESLLNELSARQEEKADLEVTLEQENRTLKEVQKELSLVAQQNNRLQSEIKRTKEKAEATKNQAETVKERIIKKPPLKKDDPVKNDAGGEEEYLIGLKVEGERIAFLVDTSASMTDEKLVDIITRKAGSDQDKQKGPKWDRTKRIVKWLANRVPNGSEATFLGFSDKVTELGDGWITGGDAAGVASVFSDLETVIPKGATNLEAALENAKSLRPRPTNYYVITDGLPTQGTSNYKSLNPFAKCSALFGQSSVISGECRSRLFVHTVKNAGLKKSTPLNVVLLPLEGDPQAAPLFWAWAYSTGGLMISPAVNWP